MFLSGSQSSSSGQSSSGIFGRVKSRAKKLSDRSLFFLRFPLFFLLAYLLWVYTTPVANKVYTFCGEKVIMLLDRDNFTKSITAEGKYIIISYDPSPDGEPRVTGYDVYTFNTAFLVALIMAVPWINYKLRIKILLLGLILLYPIQILRLAVYVFDFYGQHMKWGSGEPYYSTFFRKTFFFSKRVLARLDGQLIPIIIWAGLYYYYKWHHMFMKRIQGKASPEPEAK